MTWWKSMSLHVPGRSDAESHEPPLPTRLRSCLPSTAREDSTTRRGRVQDDPLGSRRRCRLARRPSSPSSTSQVKSSITGLARSLRHISSRRCRAARRRLVEREDRAPCRPGRAPRGTEPLQRPLDGAWDRIPRRSRTTIRAFVVRPPPFEPDAPEDASTWRRYQPGSKQAFSASGRALRHLGIGLQALQERPPFLPRPHCVPLDHPVGRLARGPASVRARRTRWGTPGRTARSRFSRIRSG